MGPAEKEREGVMLHLKQEEYTPAPLVQKYKRLIRRFILQESNRALEDPKI